MIGDRRRVTFTEHGRPVWYRALRVYPVQPVKTISNNRQSLPNNKE
jgi:hypothetical protein